jgi:hypothetical protein
MANHQRDPRKERFWRRMVRRWQRSKLTIRDFCCQQQLSEPSFYAWRRLIAERDRQCPAPKPAPTPAFVPIQVVPPIGPSAAIELVLGNGRLVRVPAGFDPATLRQLLAVLEEERPC